MSHPKCSNSFIYKTVKSCIKVASNSKSKEARLKVLSLPHLALLFKCDVSNCDHRQTSNIMIAKLTAENLRKSFPQHFAVHCPHLPTMLLQCKMQRFAAAQAAQQEAAGGAKKALFGKVSCRLEIFLSHIRT